MLMNFGSIEFKLYRPFTSLSSSASSSFDNDEIRSDGYPSCSKLAGIQRTKPKSIRRNNRRGKAMILIIMNDFFYFVYLSIYIYLYLFECMNDDDDDNNEEMTSFPRFRL